MGVAIRGAMKIFQNPHPQYVIDPIAHSAHSCNKYGCDFLKKVPPPPPKKKILDP